MKQVVAYVTAYHGDSERRAFALTCQHRSTRRKPTSVILERSFASACTILSARAFVVGRDGFMSCCDGRAGMRDAI